MSNPEYEHYIRSSKWKKTADRRLEQDHHLCCVCGGPATEVHHLTYDHFRNEKPEDLVSLCHTCHVQAEKIYDPAVTPWAVNRSGMAGNNFMAAMRTDARGLGPMIFRYLTEVRGGDFEALMKLRQPAEGDDQNYWSPLKKAVNALCRKRYSLCCAEDRRSMAMEIMTDHIETICLAEIEHFVRNRVQGALNEIVTTDYLLFGKWKDVGRSLGLTPGTLQKLRKDDGTPFGPSLRETVLYYCGLDAAAGIRPADGFQCLTEDDYRALNGMADHMAEVSVAEQFSKP